MAVIGVVTLRGCLYCGEVAPVLTRYCPLPDFTDLSTLFKLVVRKVREGSSDCDIAFCYSEIGMVTCDIEVSRYKGENRGKSSSSEDESPDLALFWAIYKLMEGEDETNPDLGK